MNTKEESTSIMEIDALRATIAKMEKNVAIVAEYGMDKLANDARDLIRVLKAKLRVMEDSIHDTTYDPTYTGRYHCINCGYVSVHELDLEQTEFLDLHCKCGGAVVRVPAEEDCGAYDVFDVVLGDES